MKNILSTEKFERAINECDGSLAIGKENSFMMLELAKCEKEFSKFLECVGDKEESRCLSDEFETLRDKCVILALKKIMMG